MPNWLARLDVGKVLLVALGPRTQRWIAALEAGKVKVGARREPVVDADGLILLVQCACRT